MPRAILTFRLPDEQAEFDAAVNGSRAKAVLWEIDNELRAMLKHLQPGPETARLAKQIREMIRNEPGLVD